MPFTFTAESALSLIDTPLNLWPREAREAAQHEIARYCYEVVRTNGTLEEARSNSNHALLHEGVSEYWGREEWTMHTRFREAVRNGTFVPRFDQPTPTLTANGDAKARDAQAAALATMRRREAMALADRANADARIRDLEARLAAAEAPRVERASIAWGPSHPDWDRFWLQAARDAEKAGNCGEYDRHANEMGAPTRDDFRRRGEDLNPVMMYQHTVDVTLPVTFTVYVTTTGEGSEPDSYAVLQALRDQDSDDSSAIENAVANASWRTISWDVSDTSEDSESDDCSPVWVNPGRE